MVSSGVYIIEFRFREAKGFDKLAIGNTWRTYTTLRDEQECTRQLCVLKHSAPHCEFRMRDNNGHKWR